MTWSLKPLLKTNAIWHLLESDMLQDTDSYFLYQHPPSCSDCLECVFEGLDLKYFPAESLVMLREEPLCPGGTEFLQGVYVKSV